MITAKISSVWPEWQVATLIGEGSYGKVYKVVRKEHGVTSYAAVKVISIPRSENDAENIVADFVGEIKVMEALKGTANIVSIEDYKVLEKDDTTGWDILIRMELLTPLNDYIASRELTESEIIKLGQDVCSALELCVKRNVIHRDIKPENIFISAFGDFKLGDFGVARELESVKDPFINRGTHNYMAPEIMLAKQYDSTVDTYSLGLILYKLLNNNRLPFLDPNSQLLSYQERKNAVERRMKGEKIEAPVNANPDLAKVILKALAFNPAERFQNPAEFKNALNTMDSVGQKPKVRLGYLLPAAIFGCFLIAGIAAFMMRWEVDRADPQIPLDEKDEVSLLIDEMSIALPVTNEDMITFRLSAPANMPYEDYVKSLAVIAKRVETLTAHAMIEDHNQAITITMPREDLGATSRLIENNLTFISGVGDFFFYSENSFFLDADEIISAEVKTGQIDFEIPKINNWKYDFMANADRNKMNYIQVKVNESGAAKIKNTPDDLFIICSNTTVFNHDKTFMGAHSADIGLFSRVRGKDDEFQIILYDFTNIEQNNLVAAVMLSPLLSHRFTYEIEAEIKWESTDEISVDSVTLLYQIPDHIFYGNFTAEDYGAIVSVLKSRMDALGTDYVFGYSGLDGKNIAIKTSPRKLGLDFTELISSAEGSISIETDVETIFDSDSILQFIISERGNSYTIDVLADSKSYADKAAEMLNKTIYLKIDDIRVSSLFVSELNTSGFFSFSKMDFVSHPKMSKENKFILDFLEEVVNSEIKMPEYMRLDFVKAIWNYETDVRNHLRWGVNSDSENDAKIREIIAERFDGVEVFRASGGRRLNFNLNLKISDDFPQRFLFLIEEIYTECDFDNAGYTSLYFSNGSDDGKISVLFTRTPYSPYSLYDESYFGKMRRWIYSTGPTYAKYIEETKALCDGMTFFEDKPVDPFMD